MILLVSFIQLYFLSSLSILVKFRGYCGGSQEENLRRFTKIINTYHETISTPDCVDVKHWRRRWHKTLDRLC
jgi:hypothetical protein